MPLTAEKWGQTGMNSDQSGTNGDKIRTSGWAPLPLFGVIAGFMLAVILVNISSNLIEQPDLPVWKPSLAEFSSYIGIVIFVPVLWWSWRRFHWTKGGVAHILTAQACSFLLFSVGHIAVMALLRHVGYALMGETYSFSDGRLALVLIYESRKDFLTFVLISGIFWTYERLSAPPVTAKAPRIAVHADGRTLLLEPDEIISVEAAGNYIEMHLAKGRPLLLRATLAEYERKLGGDFARVHRARLVNHNHIREIAVTSAGDPHLVMSDGRGIVGSRRYRSQLKIG
jgi:DNA-binding LytR/AlgR family response regulator